MSRLSVFTAETAMANCSEATRADTINKRSMKNLMSRGNFLGKVFFGLLVSTIVLSIGMGFSSCTKVDAQNPNNSNGQQSGNSNAPERWEYKMIRLSGSEKSLEENTNTVNNLGNDGWELVSAGHVGNSADFLFTFKRKK